MISYSFLIARIKVSGQNHIIAHSTTQCHGEQSVG